jgi:hypothetical protein
MFYTAIVNDCRKLSSGRFLFQDSACLAQTGGQNKLSSHRPCLVVSGEFDMDANTEYRLQETSPDTLGIQV